MCVASAGFSSFFNGLVVFTILGYMAKQSGMDVHEVASASGKCNKLQKRFCDNLQHGFFT